MYSLISSVVRDTRFTKMRCFKVIFLVAAITGVAKCCTNDEECLISGTTCSDNECTCAKGYLLSADGTQCLPYVTEYYGSCSEDAQCEWLGANSHCKYVCRCDEGYRWYLGKCLKYVGLGEKCTNSIDCYDGYNLQSMTCDDGTCSCADGYYQRGDTDCRKKALNVNDICALNVDCQVPHTDTVCHLGKCQPPENHLEDVVLEEDEEPIISYNLKVGTNCTSDEDCEDINSYCYDKTASCICKPQYFLSDGTCIAELGVDVGCTNDSDCVLKPGTCDNGICYCRDYYVTGADNRKCFKTISEENWNCLSHEWCYALGSHGYCASNGTCSCSIVSDYDTDNTLCKWTGENDPDICVMDVDCKYINNGFCVDEQCGCKPGTVLEETRCIPGIGSFCSEEVECEVPNSVCQEGVCQCIKDYLVFEGKCYLGLDSLNSTCEVDFQCSEAVLYSKCVNNTCICDEEHLEFQNACFVKTEYGSHCNTLRECSLSLGDSMGDTVVCRNHLCQCATGYTFEDNRCSSGVWSRGNLLIIAGVLLLKSVFSVS